MCLHSTKGGVIEDKGTGKVTSPTIMWVKVCTSIYYLLSFILFQLINYYKF